MIIVGLHGDFNTCFIKLDFSYFTVFVDASDDAPSQIASASVTSKRR